MARTGNIPLRIQTGIARDDEGGWWVAMRYSDPDGNVVSERLYGMRVDGSDTPGPFPDEATAEAHAQECSKMARWALAAAGLPVYRTRPGSVNPPAPTRRTNAHHRHPKRTR